MIKSFTDSLSNQKVKKGITLATLGIGLLSLGKDLKIR